MDKQEHEKPGEDELSLSSISSSLAKVFEGCTPEIKRIFSFPYLCFYTVIDAYKNQLSSAQKDELLYAFVREREAVRELIAKHVKICPGNEPGDRMSYFKDYEIWFENLETLFRESLFHNSFESTLDFLDFKSSLFSKIGDLSGRQFVLLSRLCVMLEITMESFESTVQALENIGRLPEGTLESIEETQAEIEELGKSKKMYKDAIDRLTEEVKRFEDSQKQEIEPAEAGQARKDFLRGIAKQTEDLFVKYPQAEELFKSNAKTFKVLFDKWKLASDNQPQPYFDPSGNKGKDGYEYDEDDQMWFPVQTRELPPNPALWEIEDKLCCHYVTLGIIRDTVCADSAKPIVKDILKGVNTVADAFSFVSYFIENANHKVYFDDSIELALKRVEADLVRQPAETEQSEPKKSAETRQKTETVEELAKRVVKWEDLIIEFTDDDTVRYKVGHRKWERAGYETLGFNDKRRGLPNKLWPFFQELAKYCKNGWVEIHTPKNINKDIDRICGTLKAFFGPQERPIQYDKKSKRFKVKFNLSYKQDS